MISGTTYEQGDLLLLPFPFTDLSAAKQRPVVVLSKTSYNHTHKDLIVCGVTSNLRDRTHAVRIDTRDMSTGTLPKQSLVKVDKLFTLHASTVRRRLGKVNAQAFAQVRRTFLALV